jgi:hypothetical protein
MDAIWMHEGKHTSWARSSSQTVCIIHTRAVLCVKVPGGRVIISALRVRRRCIGWQCIRQPMLAESLCAPPLWWPARDDCPLSQPRPPSPFMSAAVLRKKALYSRAMLCSGYASKKARPNCTIAWRASVCPGSTENLIPSASPDPNVLLSTTNPEGTSRSAVVSVFGGITLQRPRYMGILAVQVRCIRTKHKINC